MTDDEIVTSVLRREGGFVDHPADKGGATNWGVTQATLAEWRGHAVNAADVKAMPETEARDIYRQRYIVDPGLFKVKDDRLRAFLVDCAVNHGARNAVRFIQRGLRVHDDGVFGDETFTAMVSADPATTYRRAVAERVRFYGRLISGDRSQAAFAAGWLNRVAEFVEAA